MNITVKLIKIDKDNWKQAIKLKTSKDHKDFVHSNTYSIAEAQFHPGLEIYGVYDKKTMVGFVMYGIDKNSKDKKFWVWRMMIADNHRGKGYGKEALKLIIKDTIKNKQKVLLLSVLSNNKKAIALYRSLGFKPTGNVLESEDEYILDLTSS